MPTHIPLKTRDLNSIACHTNFFRRERAGVGVLLLIKLHVSKFDVSCN